MILLAEIDKHITERSRKFYDGTFKLDSNGFTDDVGVYRRFNCYDPAARAPTPLPPIFLDDVKDGGTEEGTATAPDEHRLTRSISLRFSELAGSTRDTSSVSLADQAKKCAGPATVTSTKTKPAAAKASLSSDDDLSDFPSDISEQGIVQTTSTAKAKRKLQNTPDDEYTPSKGRLTTRGVAQKVVRKATKSKEVKPSAAPVLLKSKGTTARRQSTRQKKAQGGGE